MADADRTTAVVEGCGCFAVASLLSLASIAGFMGRFVDTGDADNNRWGWLLMGAAAVAWLVLITVVWNKRHSP